MEELKRIFQKPAVKVCILGILAFINSILCNYTVGTIILWRWALLLFFATINILALVKYSKGETDKNKELDEARELNDALTLSLSTYATSLQGITEICKFCAEKVNVQIHEIIENSRLDCKTWNFDVACEAVCKAIYQYIIQNLNLNHTSGGIIDIEVAYVKLVEDDRRQGNPVDRISLSGYYHPTRNGPRIQGKKRIIEEGGYRDAQLFYKKIDSPDIQLNATDIQSVFKNQDNKDYSQYVGIPVFCSTSENMSKMIGLLEIVCHSDSILSTNREGLERISNRLFTPYAYLFLLLFKMDKALRATPREGGK